MDDNIQKFADFLDYYKEDYAKTCTILSKPSLDDEEVFNESDLNSLVTNDYPMLDFDGMCDDSNFYPKRPVPAKNRPKTVDALYYRIISSNKLEFYLTEFKGAFLDWNSKGDYESSLNKVLNVIPDECITQRAQKGIDRLNSIKNTHGSTVDFSLKLKPYDSLFIVLPKIYEEYCENKNIPIEERLNLYDFFKSDYCDIFLIIVGKVTNSHKENLDKFYQFMLSSPLLKQYKRLEMVNILNCNKKIFYISDNFMEITHSFKNYDDKCLRTLNSP